jgi:aryl-alcohol dehydrogenase-like predicted oxidoreductase
MVEEASFGTRPVRVSRVGLGCSRLNPFSRTRFSVARDVVREAIDRGITFFDTADSYGAGWGERWLGRALGSRRDEVLIATKCGHPATLSGKLLSRIPKARRSRSLPFPQANHLFSPEYIESAVLDSLLRLGSEHVDVLMLHSPPATVLSDGSWAEVLSSLRDRGLIRFFGISARSSDDAALAIRDHDVDCVEIELNPCTIASAEPVLALARAHGTAVVARQVFGSGRLLDLPSELSSLAGTNGRPEVAAALRQFVLSTPEVSVMILGMRSVNHVLSNTSPYTPEPELVQDVAQAARALCSVAGKRSG